MDRSAWGFVSGMVNALHERLLDQRAILAVAQTASTEDRRARLRSSLLFSETPPGSRPLEEIEGRFAELVQRFARISPDPRIGELFLNERKWVEFRRLAREFAQKKGGRASLGVEERSRIEAVLRGETQFAEATQKLIAASPPEGESIGWVDRLLDPYEARALIEIAGALESDALTSWVRAWAWCRAALAMLRGRRHGWEMDELLAIWSEAGFDSPDLMELARAPESSWVPSLRNLGLPDMADALASPHPTVELARRIDDRITHLTAGARGIPFGPEPVFAFLWAVRIEALNLRLALCAAECKMPLERVSAELRATNA